MAVSTEDELNALYADNNTQQISAADLRCLVDTLFQDRQRRRQATVFARTTGAGKPTPGAIGASEYLQYDIGDSGYYHVTLPRDFDPSQDVIVQLDFAPAAAEAGKVVSWQLDYHVMGTDGGSIDTIDGTLTNADEALPSAQWEDEHSMFTIPAASFAAGDHEIHMKITRIASSNDPATSPVVHHVFATTTIRWPGAA